MVQNTIDSSNATSAIDAPQQNLAGPTFANDNGVHVVSKSYDDVYVFSPEDSSVRDSCSQAVHNTPVESATSKRLNRDRLGTIGPPSSSYIFHSSSAPSSMRISIFTTRVTTVEPGTKTKFVTITDSKATPPAPPATITLVKTALPAPTTVLLTLTQIERPRSTRSLSSPVISSSAVDDPPAASLASAIPSRTSTTQPTSEVPLVSQESSIGQHHPESNQPQTVVILASTICGAVALGLIGLLLYCCFKRRKKHRRYRPSSSSSSVHGRKRHRGWPLWPAADTANRASMGGTYDAPDMASTSNTTLVASNKMSKPGPPAPPVPMRHPNHSQPDLFGSEVATATVTTSPPRPRRPTTSTVQRTFQGLLLPPSPAFQNTQHQADPANPQLHVNMPSPVPGTAITAPFVVPAGRRSLLPAPLRSSNRFSDFRFSLSPNPVLKPPPQPPSRPSAAVVRALGNRSPKFASPSVSHNATMGGAGHLALPTLSPARTVSRKSNASSYISWATSRRVSVDSTGRKRRSDPFDLEQGLNWQEPYSAGTRSYQYQYPFR